MNFMDNHSAYNKVTSGLKIDNHSSVNSYILISKIKKITKDYYFKYEDVADVMLARNRYSSYEVMNKFISKLDKMNTDSLKKVLTLFEKNVFKTIRIIEKNPIKYLIKKKILVNGK